MKLILFRSNIFSFVLVVLAAICCAGVSAQMIPDAPIKNFRLPLFGDNGYKEWELRGLEGHYISEGEAQVDGLDLLVFSGDEEMALESRIRSPEAFIEFELSRASGQSSLFMTGPGFEIEGSDWIWEGKEKRLRVFRNARVIFEQQIIILK